MTVDDCCQTDGVTYRRRETVVERESRERGRETCEDEREDVNVLQMMTDDSC